MIAFIKQQLASSPKLEDVARVLNNLSANLSDIFDGVSADPQINGILLPGISLASGSNQIAHTLGKRLIGWQITRQRASATVYDAQDSQPLPSTYLTLVASAPVVVDLLVF